MKKGITRGILYAFVHFSLEAACFYFLFGRFGANEYWILFALLYDCLAFVPQALFGALQDRFPKLDLGTCGGIMSLYAMTVPAYACIKICRISKCYLLKIEAYIILPCRELSVKSCFCIII